MSDFTEDPFIPIGGSHSKLKKNCFVYFFPLLEVDNLVGEANAARQGEGLERARRTNALSTLAGIPVLCVKQ